MGSNVLWHRIAQEKSLRRCPLLLCEDWRRGAIIPVIVPFLAHLDRELVKINISENKKEEAIELDDKLYISDKVEK